MNAPGLGHHDHRRVFLHSQTPRPQHLIYNNENNPLSADSNPQSNPQSPNHRPQNRSPPSTLPPPIPGTALLPPKDRSRIIQRQSQRAATSSRVGAVAGRVAGVVRQQHAEGVERVAAPALARELEAGEPERVRRRVARAEIQASLYRHVPRQHLVNPVQGAHAVRPGEPERLVPAAYVRVVAVAAVDDVEDCGVGWGGRGCG